MTVNLTNPYLAISVRPECGGRIDQITDLARDKAWLWHPSGYDPAAPRVLASEPGFDAHWQGGFEEMFPNDAPCTVAGRRLPDHGEAWSGVWTVNASTPHSLAMQLTCKSVPVRLEKTLRLEPDAPVLHLRYSMVNLGTERLPCMLKLHPALAIEEGDQIELPGCNVEAVALDFSRLIGSPAPSRWPEAQGADGRPVRLDRALPITTQAREFIYCSELEEGRCGVRNARTGSRFQLEFDRADFPFVWVFQSYGGFHGHYVLMLEPCTGKPYDLNDVIAQDNALWLAPATERTLDITLKVR